MVGTSRLVFRRLIPPSLGDRRALGAQPNHFPYDPGKVTLFSSLWAAKVYLPVEFTLEKKRAKFPICSMGTGMFTYLPSENHRFKPNTGVSIVLWISMGFEVSGNIRFRLRDSKKACKMIICHLSQP